MNAHSWYIHSGEVMMTPVMIAIFRRRNSESNTPVTYRVQPCDLTWPGIAWVGRSSRQYGASMKCQV